MTPLQRNFIHGVSDELGTHTSVLRDHYVFASRATKRVEERNRLVMARLVVGAIVSAGCNDEELVLRVQQTILRNRAFPSPATIQRTLAKFRVDGVEPLSLDDYYASDVWRRRRDLYFERHPKDCALGSRHPGVVQLHHNTYERIGGNELDSDLTPLCRPCHAKYHDVLP